MSEAKLELGLGALSFSGEGEQDWLARQLDKVLEAAPKLAKIQPRGSLAATEGDIDALPEGEFTATLASYIKRRKAESNQVQRFLATADWLRRRGMSLTTAAVSKALSDNHQKRLANPADCLNKNVAKGFCEKKGDGFFVTPDGLKQLGTG